MTNPNYEIVKVQAFDFQKLSELSKRIYAQTYTYLWYDAGEWYTKKMYNPEKILEELSDENSEFFYFILDEKPIGYLKLNLKSQFGNDGLDIERIYFDTNLAGKGFGSILLNFGIEKAKNLGRKNVLLKVMNCHTPAIRFYEKHGFKTIGNMFLDFETMKDEYRQLNTMVLSFEK